MSSDIHALSGAYVIDALDDDERAAFESHLAECATCREEVDGLAETAGLLAGTAETVPPPDLRARVLAGIGQVRPLPPLLESRRRVQRPQRWSLWAAAAAVVFTLGAGVTVWQPWSEDLAHVSSPVARVLEAPDAERFEHSLPDGSSATVVRSRELGRAVIVTDDMAPAPAGKVYQVWLQVGREMRPAGLMPDRSDATVLLDGDAASAQGVGITVEPDGGSEAPTSAPVALIPLES